MARYRVRYGPVGIRYYDVDAQNALHAQRLANELWRQENQPNVSAVEERQAPSPPRDSRVLYLRTALEGGPP